MSVFAYQATTTREGGKRKGTIAADTPRAAREALRARGLRIQRLTPVRADARAGSTPLAALQERFVASRRRRHVVPLLGELATLLGVGVPLLEALDGAIRQAGRHGFRDNLALLRDAIAAGSTLADAMAAQPMLFDRLCVSMVNVGERSGKLDEVLGQLAEFKQRGELLKGRLGTALIYPAIVLAAGCGVTLFLMTYVVPRLLEALVDAGQELPWMTRAVKWASDGLLSYGWLLAIGTFAVGVAVGLLLRRPGVRLRWHRLILSLPIVGEMVRKQAMIRIAATIATLTRSGVEFIDAIRIVQQSMPNLVIRDALIACEQAVGAGRDIAPALESTGVFPHAMIQVFAVGQASGRLDDMLERIATDYDKQVNVLSQRLVAILEPAMILLLALFVGMIVLSIILPYMEAGNVM